MLANVLIRFEFVSLTEIRSLVLWEGKKTLTTIFARYFRMYHFVSPVQPCKGLVIYPIS